MDNKLIQDQLDSVKYKPASKIPFTEENWNNFKERLAKALRDHGMDTNQIMTDGEMKQYMENYVQQELFNEKNEAKRLLTNTNVRLAHLTLSTSTGERVFPVIFTYFGHHVIGGTFFFKDKKGEPDLETIKVIESIITM